jgi:hypothetical protein
MTTTGSEAGAGTNTAGEPARSWLASPRANPLVAVVVGLVTLTILDIVAIIVFRGSTDTAVAVTGAVNSPIVAIVSAYFGIKVGAETGGAGRDAAEQARNAAQTQTMALLGQMTPEQATPILHSLSIPVPVGTAQTDAPQGK